MKCGGVCVAQIVFGRVEKTISAPTSPAISRSSTPAPSELDDEEDRDEEDEEADSEEEREELSKRETVSSLRDYAPNPAQDMMPANSAWTHRKRSVGHGSFLWPDTTHARTDPTRLIRDGMCPDKT